MTMPRLLVPLPLRSMLPVEARPDEGGKMFPLVVSIRTPRPPSALTLEIDPLLTNELLESMVTTGAEAVEMAILDPLSMVILPLVEVKSAAEVLVLTSVSARADISVARGGRKRGV